jgi:transcription elongation GreA/GreB family factor
MNDSPKTPRPRSPAQSASAKSASAKSASANADEARLRQQAIGVRLRHMFEEVVNEPVPDEFLEILRRGDKAGPGGGSGTGA